MEQPLWTPSQKRVAETNLTQYQKYINQCYNLNLSGYNQLYVWSVDNIEQFWESIWNYSDIIHSKKYTEILSGQKMFGSRWFDGAKLNFAENLLRYQDDKCAISYLKENGQSKKYTYRQLYDITTKTATGLKNIGVTKNDRVVAFIPNIPEAVIGMLATTSIGAIWSSCSPDFGIDGVYDRFNQIEPKVLITTDSYTYNGKTYDLTDKIKTLSKKIKSLEKIIVISDKQSPELKSIPNMIFWNDLINNNNHELIFEQLPFNHPVYIMYSSGTTGKPKCLVHGAGGTLLQHFKEHHLHTDIKRDDVVFYFSTTGWMMWNWLVGVLSSGATILLYDGAPSYPNLDTLWQTIEKEQISVFGTSPKFLSACQNTRVDPKKYNLSSLKSILSTGSPLSKENYNYVYNNIKTDIQLSSISGGTDIISCFMLGNPNLPVYEEQIQCRGLGMKVETFNPESKSIINQIGELVCTKPFVSMPICFWNDPKNKIYHKAYFEKFENVWTHGDYIKITENGGVIVYGRSDATLNPGGIRIGTAEIYNPIEAMDEIIDSLVIGMKNNNDTDIALFVILKKNLKLDFELTKKIKNSIKENNTPRHVPKFIYQITDIPRTLNGKKVELAVTNLIHGREITNKEALANPESLKQFEKYKL